MIKIQSINSPIIFIEIFLLSFLQLGTTVTSICGSTTRINNCTDNEIRTQDGWLLNKDHVYVVNNADKIGTCTSPKDQTCCGYIAPNNAGTPGFCPYTHPPSRFLRLPNLIVKEAKLKFGNNKNLVVQNVGGETVAPTVAPTPSPVPGYGDDDDHHHGRPKHRPSPRPRPPVPTPRPENHESGNHHHEEHHHEEHQEVDPISALIANEDGVPAQQKGSVDQAIASEDGITLPQQQASVDDAIANSDGINTNKKHDNHFDDEDDVAVKSNSSPKTSLGKSSSQKHESHEQNSHSNGHQEVDTISKLIDSEDGVAPQKGNVDEAIASEDGITPAKQQASVDDAIANSDGINTNKKHDSSNLKEKESVQHKSKPNKNDDDDDEDDDEDFKPKTNNKPVTQSKPKPSSTQHKTSSSSQSKTSSRPHLPFHRPAQAKPVTQHKTASQQHKASSSNKHKPSEAPKKHDAEDENDELDPPSFYVKHASSSGNNKPHYEEVANPHKDQPAPQRETYEFDRKVGSSISIDDGISIEEESDEQKK